MCRHAVHAVADAARSWEDALNSAVRRMDVVAEQALNTVGSAARSVPAAFGLASSQPVRAFQAQRALHVGIHLSDLASMFLCSSCAV